MAKPSISVRIVLSEDISTATPTPKSVVRHCGDEILGYLEVITWGLSSLMSLSLLKVAFRVLSYS